ncbi:response regulator [Ramlibacter tataouinensis]|uniref:response regulator n=1 Tax=Ramlibacter tataouinensis TaxID=94132 RepID=UPI0022F3C33F|nr:response regulator [Ramlibacter tataouinensis]WBY03109.1 response regulator [Ramlibacter tataouinensis]
MPHDPSTFRQILARNVALPLVLTAASALLFIGVIAYLLQANATIEATDRVITRAFALQKMDLALESSLRGYLLDGEERFLETFEITRTQLADEKARLHALVTSPQQQERLERIELLQAQWNAYADRHIRARRTNPGYHIGDAIMEGVRLKAALREQFDGFIEHERRSRLDRVDAARRNTLMLGAAFVLLMLGIGALVAWRGRSELLALSGAFNAALDEQARQAQALQAQAWLQEARSQVAERIAREQELGAVGHAGLDALAGAIGVAVGAVYAAEPGGAWARVATWGWAPGADGADARVEPGRSLLAECAAQRRPIALDDVPPGYLKVTSALGQATAGSVLLSPIEHEGRLVGVLEVGFLRPLQPRDHELVAAASSLFGASLEAASYRQRLQASLEESQQLNEELQVQQEELRTTNEELEEHARALRESQSRLESQQAELQQSNAQLTDQARRLEEQRDELRQARQALEERAAELQRASRYKSEFLANMSHELRTPLNSSLILSRLLADNPEGNLTPEQVEFAGAITSAGNELLNLINDILDIAKVEAGRLEVRPEVTPVAAVAEGLRGLFQPLCVRKGLALELAIAPDVPATLYTDRQRLEQILRNLLANAVKFTAQGRVSLRAQRREGDRIAFEVQDTGIGIEPAQQQLIFEAFRQADGTISRRFGGTGLGLAISRDLARMLGGDIALASPPGAGSTFTVTLPLEYRAAASMPAPAATPSPVTSAAPAPPAPAATPAPPPTGPAFPDDRDAPAEGRRTVLVVEDDVTFARILYDLAHQQGYRCLVAHQAEAGVELAFAHAPDAVLLDMRLSGDSGLTVLQRLKDDPRTRHLPVHVISVEDRSEPALQLGAIGYARKPATREQLQDVFARMEAKLDQEVKRVLVVEDDPRQQESIARLIGGEDVEITGVAQGHEALQALAASVFDVMVIDLKLPDMSGQELLRRMAAGEGGSYPPVIVYTGHNLSRDEEAELRRYSHSIIIKGARSPERLLDEVTLFLHQVENRLSPERQKMLRAARSRDKAFEGRRILVVDDDMRNVFALTSALEHKGAVVETARNGQEALERLRNATDEVDLVLMDIMMPGMDGYAATREIRRDPRFARLPVIAVTAKAMKEDQQRCLDAGASDYLSKPIELERLFSLMRIWMPKLERL